jgi:hypothetical protein
LNKLRVQFGSELVAQALAIAERGEKQRRLSISGQRCRHHTEAVAARARQNLFRVRPSS